MWPLNFDPPFFGTSSPNSTFSYETFRKSTKVRTLTQLPKAQIWGWFSKILMVSNQIEQTRRYFWSLTDEEKTGCETRWHTQKRSFQLIWLHAGMVSFFFITQCPWSKFVLVLHLRSMQAASMIYVNASEFCLDFSQTFEVLFLNTTYGCNRLFCACFFLRASQQLK